MILRPLPRSKAILLAISSLLVLFGAYTGLSYRQHQKNPDDTTIPTWSQLKQGVVQMCEANKRSGERWITADVKATALRFFSGLALGAGAAVVLGLLMG